MKLTLTFAYVIRYRVVSDVNPSNFFGPEVEELPDAITLWHEADSQFPNEQWVVKAYVERIVK